LAVFDTVAASYGKRTDYDPRFFQRLVQALGVNTTTSVLDIATGTGALAAGLSPYARRIYALDQSTGMLAIAQRRSNIDYTEHDINTAPFAPSEVCDHVVIGRAIHHLDSQALKATLDLALAPEGQVAICASGFQNGMPWVSLYNTTRQTYRRPDPLAGHNQALIKLGQMGYVQCGSVASVVEGEASTADLFEHALSYSRTREPILQDREAFCAKLDKLIDQYGVDGRVKTAVISWAKLYTRAAPLTLS